jgi:hypothetical protein
MNRGRIGFSRVAPKIVRRKERCSSGREKISSVQHGDDLAAREQFFKIVAIEQLFGRQDPLPKGWTDDSKFGLTKKVNDVAHGSSSSTDHATAALAGGGSKSQAPNFKLRQKFLEPGGLHIGVLEAGWLTGLEPATTRTTIWGSTIELQPPSEPLDSRF